MFNAVSIFGEKVVKTLKSRGIVVTGFVRGSTRCYVVRDNGDFYARFKFQILDLAA